ncbi:penicillin-binding protein 2 [Candidatus Kuenenbacteria bacterium CG11_big_fil_rev_8_21_14_0_20_37_9]|uniref:Penicillin-binding protein 2 n=1 Tax=Candidatus Kuenenbacteria bacterium CG1_02_38_13 TaxID=1805235 RepID=A0A1J4U284_9BACT|nr:MAG: penicillin-binding protein 2 [Candidatus Kuenenbacteria bacterium CG1_02_38_13]PIR05502.1 MAG: penicillin-binding protein 2 [Candidatus Kuenenbacteria bacterium CG11_big_fil_rev_8_21_14_0_20_37_9]
MARVVKLCDTILIFMLNIKKQDNPFVIKGKVGSVKNFCLMKREGDSFFVSGFNEQLRSGIEDKKIFIAFWAIIFFMLIIVMRLFWLQVVAGDKYDFVAEGNRIRVSTVLAERGIIYDRFNRPMVENIPSTALYFIPADLPDKRDVRKELALTLAQIIHLDENEILGLFEKSNIAQYGPELIKKNLEHEEVVLLNVFDDKLPSVKLVSETRRSYLEKSGLAHVLGYIGKINEQEIDIHKDDGYNINSVIGKDGIEFFYESALKGKDGKQEMEVDAFGKTKKILNEVKAISGSNVFLSIDFDLQQKLTENLAVAIKNSGTKAGGVAIALDPQSGEILAMVSLPDFDNNFFSAGISQQAYDNYLVNQSMPLFNRAISGIYPPGSTFKPIVAIAALEEGLINEDKTFLSTGGVAVKSWFFPDWKYGGHGRVNVVRAIAESVNTFFYYIGGGYSDFDGLGVDRITAYAKEFNLGSSLGIDLPGEAKGFLPSKEWKKEEKGEDWYIGDTYHLSIGQGDILVTPLQIANYICAIANGGTLYRPHLIKGIRRRNAENATDDIDDYAIRKNFIRNENIEIVKKGLRQAVVSGSAKSLNSLPVQVAGKTGTAQVGGGQNSHAWFVGFAPYQSPRIVVLILIENGGEGSSVAASVFGEVVEWYFN